MDCLLIRRGSKLENRLRRKIGIADSEVHTDEATDTRCNELDKFLVQGVFGFDQDSRTFDDGVDSFESRHSHGFTGF